MRILPLAALLLLASQPACSADDQRALFEGYIASPSYRAILQKAYNDAEPAVFRAKCASMTVTAFAKPEIVEPPVFARAGAGWTAQSGAWVATATLNQCGTSVIRRMLVETRSDNTLRTRGLIPGEYAGGFKLEESARGFVTMSMLNVTNCKDWRSPVLLDTRLRSNPSKQGWVETWTALICGKTVTANVYYVAEVTAPGGFDVRTHDIKTH